MRLLVIVLLLISNVSYSSDTPISGTFSNAAKNYDEYMKPTLSTRINLVVTTNDNGQQFFIQCFKGNKAGFGVLTEFKKPNIHATINAGSYCPATSVRIELDYEDAIVRSEAGWVHLVRGDIYVPIVD